MEKHFNRTKAAYGAYSSNGAVTEKSNRADTNGVKTIHRTRVREVRIQSPPAVSLMRTRLAAATRHRQRVDHLEGTLRMLFRGFELLPPGKAVIGSNVKVAAAGAALDVPLGHKDDSWSFPHFDTITVSVADAPRLPRFSTSRNECTGMSARSEAV